MIGRGAVSALALSKEVGVSQATLSRWKREASSVLDVSHEETPAKRVQDWTPEEKVKAVMETGRLSEAELGGYLRRHGLHAEHLETWRKEATEAAQQALGGERRRLQGQARRRAEANPEAGEGPPTQGEGTCGGHGPAGSEKKLEVLLEDEEDDTTQESDE